MTDVIYARAYISVGGEEYYSEPVKYSILNYIYNKLGYTGTATTNEKLDALLRGMLEYGASAQMYFDYKTEELANASLQLSQITMVQTEDFWVGLTVTELSFQIAAHMK